MKRLGWLLVGASLGLACSHMKESNVCPEYKDMQCMTVPQCSLDVNRGCKVCQCQPADTGPEGRMPPGWNPDHR